MPKPKVKETKITSQKRYQPSERDEELLKKWKARFKRAKEFRKPYQAKWLRIVSSLSSVPTQAKLCLQHSLNAPPCF